MAANAMSGTVLSAISRIYPTAFPNTLAISVLISSSSLVGSMLSPLRYDVVVQLYLY